MRNTNIHFTRWQMSKIAYHATRDQLDLIGDWFPGIKAINFIDAIHAGCKAFLHGPVTVHVAADSSTDTEQPNRNARA